MLLCALHEDQDAALVKRLYVFSIVGGEQPRATLTMTMPTTRQSVDRGVRSLLRCISAFFSDGFFNLRLIQRNGIPFIARRNLGGMSFMKNREEKVALLCEVARDTARMKPVFFFFFFFFANSLLNFSV